MKQAERQETKGSLDLLEEAVHLVRSASPAALAAYYAGAVPFVLGFLYFWADMSRSPFAERHLTESALGLAGLFLWLKFWQALFARSLRACLGSAVAPLTRGRCWRIFRSQAALQPTGLFLLPLGLAPLLPFPWLYAFYQNLTAMADDDSAQLRPLLKKAVRQAGLWPGQNWVLLMEIGAFGLFVFLNWCIVCYVLPGFFKMLLGIESMFTLSRLSLLNSTFFMVMLGLTYLCVDPVLKAVYTLRCFYGQSIESGGDLKAELSRLAARSTPAAAIVLVFVLLSQPGLAQTRVPTPQSLHEPSGEFLLTQTPLSKERGNAPRLSSVHGPIASCATEAAAHGRFEFFGYQFWAGAPEMSLKGFKADHAIVSRAAPTMQAEARQKRAAATISPTRLDQAIRETARKSKYAWRMPREPTAGMDLPQSNILERFIARVSDVVGGALRAVGRAIGWMLRKLFGGRRLARTGSSGYGWMVLLQVLLYVLAAAVLVGLALLLFRLWRERHGPAARLASEPIQPAPDLADENVGAEQLPEDGWTRLGRELLAKGEFRLALRAFYLSSLAHLAARNLVSLARYKSNRDYERELCRRGHAFPELLALFTDNLAAFEPVWYGRHPVDSDLVSVFAAKVERIRSGGAAA
jgi:Domain of unknown function (DUF4129)